MQLENSGAVLQPMFARVRVNRQRNHAGVPAHTRLVLTGLLLTPTFTSEEGIVGAT